MHHRSSTAAPTRRLLALVCAVGLAAFGLASAASAQDWVTYADESSTRINAVASLGVSDTFEKDLFAADVDNDGDLDMLVVRKERFSTQGGLRNVLFMNELGVMVDRTNTLAPDFLDVTDDRDVVLVDVDDDGWGDIVTVTTFSEQPRIYMNLGRDLGTGAWLGFDYDAADARLPTFTPGPKFCAVGFGDVTGNGTPDLFFVDYDNTLEDRLLINDGTGVFTDETATRMTPAMSFSEFGTDAHILDVDNDLDLDIVKNSASGNSGVDPNVRILYNDGTGNFDFEQRIYQDEPYMIEPADWTGDGFVDFYVVDDNQDRYLSSAGLDGNGRATFTQTTVTNSPNTAGFGGNTKIADLDADGLLDVLVTDVDTDLPGCDRQMVVLRGQGTQPNVTFSDPFNGADRTWLPNGTFDVEILDIDKDGNLDLWIGTCAGNMVQMNTSGNGVFIGDFEDGVGRWSNAVGVTP